ncbi:MAG TPA: vWA domain-containing protein [Woeseiaceae bacterium]
MKTKITGIFFFALTLAAIASYPSLNARLLTDLDNDRPAFVPDSRPKIDVVFVLDTTGSMGGLIQTAKDKIWSIARTMASAQPTPDIRIGLVAYRDRGDAYVTQVVDLSSDLDSVYAKLMDFDANGGGDTPESVNKALYDAVHKVSWSQDPQAYQVVFLVGDAPPHTDYQDELQYPEILAQARDKGIVVNTIQCGDMPITMDPWQQIASLGQGRYFQVEQAGGAVAFATPFDADIAALSAQLDRTRLYYGTGEEKERMEQKVAATDKLNSFASVESLARRGAFNASPAGSANRLGEMELVDAISSGKVSLAELDDADLPESLKPLAPAEQEAVILQRTEERHELTQQIRDLADKRDRFLEKKIAEEGGATDSLDQKIYETVSLQAAKAGLTYEGGPDY